MQIFHNRTGNLFPHDKILKILFSSHSLQNLTAIRPTYPPRVKHATRLLDVSSKKICVFFANTSEQMHAKRQSPSSLSFCHLFLNKMWFETHIFQYENHSKTY